MACACGAAVPDDYDEYSKYTMSTAHSRSSEDSDDDDDDSEVLNTSYRRVTPLFRAIEKENWEGVLSFLTKGRWSSGLLTSTNDHLRSPAPEIQAKTWVTSYDARGIPEWSQLPLHAALSYSAPFIVIKKLVQLYPKSVQCTDNEGMLPIHLAFGFGASEPVLAMLLENFPAALNERGLGGRYPYECCELGPNKVRGDVYRHVAEQITARLRREMDGEWRNFLPTAAARVGLPADDVYYKPPETLKQQKQGGDFRKLTSVLEDLMRDRKELYELKRKLRHEARVGEASSHGSTSKNHLTTVSGGNAEVAGRGGGRSSSSISRHSAAGGLPPTSSKRSTASSRRSSSVGGGVTGGNASTSHASEQSQGRESQGGRSHRSHRSQSSNHSKKVAAAATESSVQYPPSSVAAASGKFAYGRGGGGSHANSSSAYPGSSRAVGSVPRTTGTGATTLGTSAAASSRRSGWKKR